jgi:hypothetical protein
MATLTPLLFELVDQTRRHAMSSDSRGSISLEIPKTIAALNVDKVREVFDELVAADYSMDRRLISRNLGNPVTASDVMAAIVHTALDSECLKTTGCYRDPESGSIRMRRREPANA